MNDNKRKWSAQTLGATRQNYPIPVVASWSRLGSSSDSHSRCSSCALLYKANLPACRSHSTISSGYLSVNWAKSRRMRSAIGATHCRTISLFSAVSLQCSNTCSGVSGASPQLHSGVGTSETCRLNKKSAIPTHPMRNCISTEAW
jgi:hypothetical protein